MTSNKQNLRDYDLQPWNTTQAHLRSATSLVEQLNVQIVGWLATESAGQPDGAERWLLPQLGLPARQRLAQVPIVLANVHFEDGDWWRRACLQAASGDEPQRRLENARTTALTREVMTLAWYLARTPQMPRFLMGMAPDVARLLAVLSLRDIDDIAAQQYRHLRPRWEDAPEFWAELIAAAADADDERWSKVQLHALQLLGRDLLSHGTHLPMSRRRRTSV